MSAAVHLTPIERLAFDLPRHALSSFNASLKSYVLTIVILGAELMLIRSDYLLLVPLGIVIFAIHGSVALSLVRHVVALLRDIRRGIDGEDPLYLTRERVADAMSRREENRKLRWATRLILFLGYATPIYPLSKYVFLQAYDVHSEYFEAADESKARQRWQGELGLGAEVEVHSAPPANQAWTNVARASAAYAVSSFNDPGRARAHA
ncbi:MAG TPA: hypothetical protein VF167_08135 [Longimicrobiaceae bacterium]